MFRLVAYNKNKEILEKAHFLTEPDMRQIKTFSRQVTSQYGIEIEVVTEEVSYIELGMPQTEAH